jgi:hypothetical protein
MRTAIDLTGKIENSMWNKPGYVLTCPNFRKSALRRVLDWNIGIFAVDVPYIEASWANNAEEERRRDARVTAVLDKAGLRLAGARFHRRGLNCGED